MGYPSKKTLKEMDEKLKNIEGTKGLPKDATPIQMAKYNLCKQVVRHILKNKTNQKDLAESLGINPATISKIVNYNIESFTIDKLAMIVLELNPKLQIKVS